MKMSRIAHMVYVQYFFLAYTWAMKLDDDVSLLDYSNLIDLVYDAAAKPELWPELLTELSHYLAIPGDINDMGLESQHNKSDLLEPHLTRAVRLNQHIVDLETKTQTIEQIINRIPLGVIVTNADGVPLAMNSRAQTVLDAKRCLTLKNGVVSTSSPKQNSELSRLIQNYANKQGSKKGNAIVLQTKQDGLDHVTSLWLTTAGTLPNLNTHEKQLCMIYIASPLIKPTYNIESIRQSFGLTAAEAKLVETLANGCHNLNEVAESLNISIHTARSQIKTIFEKTNTNSQLELIKRILTSPSVIFGESQPLKASPQTLVGEDTDADQSICLPDGRKLGYVEYGNPDGEPVIYCHSLIHPDHQMFHIPEMQVQLKYRVISPKRSGFLHSTPVNKPCSLQEHAADIIQLANHLKLSTFKVMAHSNGCPFAAALAHDYPQRVNKLLLISGFVPPHLDDITKIKSNDRHMYKLGKFLPDKALRKVANMAIKGFFKNASSLIQSNLHHVSASELIFMKTPEVQDFLQQWIQASYPNRTEAIVQDFFVRIRNWGFNPEQVQVPVILYHAKDDSTVDISCAKRISSALPNCESHYLDSGGHYIFFTQFDKITLHF